MANQSLSNDRQGRYVPFLVLGLSLLVCGAVAYYFHYTIRHHERAQLSALASEAAEEITSRVNSHVGLLRGATGLFVADRSVTRKEFSAYVKQLRFQEQFEGTLGIGFARTARRAELDTVLAEIRSDRPDFVYRPEGERELYAFVTFLEPETELNKTAIGFDMYSEPTRRAAMERAWRGKVPAATRRVRLVQEEHVAEEQPGFLLYMPVFDEAGAGATGRLRGFVCSPLRVKDFLNGIFRHGRDQRITFDLYAADRVEKSQLLWTEEHDASAGEASAAATVPLPGLTWTLVAHPTKSFFSDGDRQIIPVVIVGGIVFSLLLFGLSLQQYRSKVTSAQAAHELAESREALAAEEERYRAMVTEVRDYAIFMVDPDGKVTSWNSGVERLLGYTEEEFIGMLTSKLFTAEQSEKGWPQEELRIAATSQRAQDEAWRVRRNGSLFWASTSITALRATDGKLLGFAKVMKDLTEQKRAEEQLLEEKHVSETLRTMAEQLASELDQNRLVQLITDEATSLIGAEYGSYFFKGKGDKKGDFTLSGVPREAFETFPMPLVSGKSIQRSDDITRDPAFSEELSETKLPVRSYISIPVKSRQGETLGVLFFGHSQPAMFTERHEKLVLGIAGQASVVLDNARLYDEAKKEINARRRAEETVRSLNAELEKRVLERTAQLEEANKELQGFCYSVSHDLRTPLRNLVASTRFLIEDYGEQLGSSGKEDLEGLNRSAYDLVQLVNDLLEFARIGQQAVDRSDIQLSSIAEAIAVELREQENCADALITVEPGMVGSGDPELLRMVVRNLMENACKYKKPDQPAVISVGSKAQDGEKVYFVKDEGIGFDMAYASKLFKPFERLHNKQDVPGTGIGLANVDRIISRHGGKVWADSSPGKGATFFFTLGVATAESREEVDEPAKSA